MFLYNIDDLQGIVERTSPGDRRELERAEAIVDEEVSRFTTWVQSREIIPTVIALRQRFEAIRQSELEPSRAQAVGPAARKRVNAGRNHAPHRPEAAPDADRTTQVGGRSPDRGLRRMRPTVFSLG